MGKPNIVFKGEIEDWRIGAGEDVSDEDKKKYQLTVELEPGGNQLYVEVLPVGIDIATSEEEPQGLSMMIEINQGKPCFHVSGLVGCDNVLHGFAVGEEIIVTPDAPGGVNAAPQSRYTYDSNDGLAYGYGYR